MPKRLSDLKPHDPEATEFYEALPTMAGRPFMDNIDPQAEAHARRALITLLIVAALAAVFLGAVIAAGLNLVQ